MIAGFRIIWVQGERQGQGSRFKVQVKARQKQGQGVGFMPDVAQRLCTSKNPNFSSGQPNGHGNCATPDNETCHDRFPHPSPHPSPRGRGGRV